MQCQVCGKTISQKDHFCRHCGTTVTPDAIQASRLREDERYHALLRNQIVARCEPASGAWGAHIYESDLASNHPRSRPRGCPEWVEARDWDRWFHAGLVVWDNATRRIGALFAAEAVRLLDDLQSNDEWKSVGIAIVERGHFIRLSRPVPTKGTQDAAAESEPSDEARHAEMSVDERLRLSDMAAEELYAFLRTHEALLRRMAAEHEKHAQETLARIYEMILGSHNKREADEIHLANRAFPWRREANGEFIAEVPPDRATVKLSADGIWWQPILERPGRFRSDHQRFLSLEEALKWAEAEIPRQRREDDEAARKRDEEKVADLKRVAALPTMDLTPYWIEPAQLEPEQVTYRAYIELEYGPAESDKQEISFGEYMHFHKKYFTAAQLAVELRLNAADVEVVQLDPGLDLYRVYSHVTYPNAPAAAAQAQQIWDQSAITEQFAEKKVDRARYGYQEPETEFCVWLGWLEQKPWPYWTRLETRQAYMKDRAMEETFSLALDVNGHRKYFQTGFNLLSDEDLLWKMHYQRSQSKFAPAAARSDSQRWLQAHPLEGRGSRSRKAKAPGAG
jgi:hypothetical protein